MSMKGKTHTAFTLYDIPLIPPTACIPFNFFCYNAYSFLFFAMKSFSIKKARVGKKKKKVSEHEVTGYLDHLAH
jgi:hypothetical protein